MAALVTAAALGGATFALAATHGGRDASGTRHAPSIAGAGKGGGCAAGYDTETGTNVPPDDSTTDNVPAATVSLKKKCRGFVVGRFTSETSTPNAGDFIHIDMRATCTGTGGFTNPCVVGQQAFASPGHTFFHNGPGEFQDTAVQMVWSNLPPGVWAFDVLPGGNNSANLQFRSFVVQAFAGG